VRPGVTRVAGSMGKGREGQECDRVAKGMGDDRGVHGCRRHGGGQGCDRVAEGMGDDRGVTWLQKAWGMKGV
jgi:hypothetical protein